MPCLKDAACVYNRLSFYMLVQEREGPERKAKDDLTSQTKTSSPTLWYCNNSQSSYIVWYVIFEHGGLALSD